MRRIASAYLWFAPLLIVAPLYFVFHHLGLSPGIGARGLANPALASY
jgi:hypothetical protein